MRSLNFNLFCNKMWPGPVTNVRQAAYYKAPSSGTVFPAPLPDSSSSHSYENPFCFGFWIQIRRNALWHFSLTAVEDAVVSQSCRLQPSRFYRV